jgi:hypothetical protein
MTWIKKHMLGRHLFACFFNFMLIVTQKTKLRKDKTSIFVKILYNPFIVLVIETRTKLENCNMQMAILFSVLILIGKGE